MRRVTAKSRKSGTPPKPPRSLGLRPIAVTCTSCCNLVTTLPIRKHTDPAKPNVCATCAKEYSKRYYVANYEKHKQNQRQLAGRRQEETLPVAHNAGKQWTGPELEVALRRDLTAREAALMLGRSHKAVGAQRYLHNKEPKKQMFAGLSDTPSTAL